MIDTDEVHLSEYIPNTNTTQLSGRRPAARRDSINKASRASCYKEPGVPYRFLGSRRCCTTNVGIPAVCTPATRLLLHVRSDRLSEAGAMQPPRINLV